IHFTHSYSPSKQASPIVMSTRLNPTPAAASIPCDQDTVQHNKGSCRRAHCMPTMNIDGQVNCEHTTTHRIYLSTGSA
ncbi:hypothetical protein BDN70DRAFT_882052, partial [Pholiota conissans]